MYSLIYIDILDDMFEYSANLALIGVPSSAGARCTGQERAPAALRATGLPERLRALGLAVADTGDLPVVSFRPDAAHPRQQNAALAADVAQQTAQRVDRALSDGQLPLVLGGDCSLSLGVVSGALRHHQRIGLLYFDGDVDLNTPETTQSGILDGMVIAHMLGRGAPQLAGVGPRCPLLSEQDIALFAYDPESGWVDPAELEVLTRSRMARYPLARVRADVTAAARAALEYLERRSDAVVVHFDVDAMNLPAADVPHPRGLDAGSAFAALRIFAASPRCAALVVTELNADADADGSQAECLAQGLVDALGVRVGRAA
jgi:arginase